MLEKCVLTVLELNYNQRNQRTKFNICHRMLTSSTHLQNRSFHVVERTRTSSKCQKMKNVRAKRAKILFFILKYANLWGFCCCRRRRSCYAPRRRRQREHHKFAYLIVKNNSFARFASEVFIFDISQTFSFFLRREMTCFAVVWTTWPWWQMFNFVFLSVKRWFQFNSRIVRTHFASVMTLNN